MQTQTKTEVIAGVSTFLTLSYIALVNPQILSTQPGGIPFSGALTATVLLTCSMTLLMGLFAKLPYAVAPGMGLNAFFIFHLVQADRIPWPIALGIVFWSGILFLAVSITPLRQWIASGIGTSLKVGSTAGIGLFLCMIGLKSGGLVESDTATLVRPSTWNSTAFLSIFSIFTLWILRFRAQTLAVLVTIFLTTLVSALMGITRIEGPFFSMPDFSSAFLKLDPMGALKWVYLPAIFSIFFTDFFDSLSTLLALSNASGLKDTNGQPKNLRRGLIVDSLATFSAGIFGTSPGTAYLESMAGVQAGGRTGLTSVVVAICFLPFLFAAPLAALIPASATAAVVIFVGIQMLSAFRDLDWDQLDEWMPGVATAALIPLLFSITQGILWGILFFVVAKLAAKKSREIQSPTWFLAVLAVILLWIENHSK